MTMRFMFSDLVARNADGGAGGAPAGGAAAGTPPPNGAAPAGDAGAAKGLLALAGQGGSGGPPAGQNNGQPQAPNGQQPPGHQPPAAPYYPDGLPDTFKGMTERETIDKLYKDIASRPKAPATPKDYKLELAPEMAKKYGDLSTDPVLAIWRETAHELGLPNEAFQGAFVKLHEKMQKAGLLDDPTELEADVKKLAPKEMDPVRQKAEASRRVDAIITEVQGFVTRGVLSKTEAVMVQAVAASADGIIALEKLFAQIKGAQGVNPGGAPAGAALSASEVQAMERDERYSSSSPKYDPEFRKRADEARRRLGAAARTTH